MKMLQTVFKKPFNQLTKTLSLVAAFVMLAILANAQDITVKGKVTGDKNEPIAGASVQIKGTTRGTTTNDSGDFTISVPGNGTLVISAVNFKEQEFAIGGKTTISATLSATASTLNDVVVVGYGTQRKIDVTGSVATVSGAEISKQASINPIGALQGKVAGVQIINAGAPGASPTIKIRGFGTIYGNVSPLYVVDGVWFSDISFLNPADIETLNILKDASSQSIYGVRAANGVVLITTKKGRSGKAVVSYNGYVGYQKVTNELEMANAKEYATIINELKGSQLLDPAAFGEGTDWNHQILRNALVTSHQVSVSGGGDRSTYLFSLGYLKQDGIVEKNSYDRYTLRLQNDFQVANPLKLGYTITSAFSKSNDIPGGIFRQIYAASPVVPVKYADGSYGDPADFNLGDGANFNPQATLDFYDQKSKNYRLTGAVYGDLKFAKHFTLHSSIGGEMAQAESRNFIPIYTATLAQRNALTSLTINRGETRNWILENTLTYDNRFGDHSVKVLLGQGAQRNKFYNITGTGRGVPGRGEGDLYLSLADATTVTYKDGGSLSTTRAYFARVNYSFQNKYLLTASLRNDAFSAFGGEDFTLPSIGAGWIISEENFMKNQKTFDYLKLKGSWGKIGNANVPLNPSTATTSLYTAIFNGVAYPGENINSVVPPVITIEKGVGTDIGLEASFINRKLTIEADYYNRKTKDAIFPIPILSSIGTGSSRLVGNQADIENKGFEFTATWKDNVNADFSYSVSGNISINDNKVTNVVTGKNPIYSGGGGIANGALATQTILGNPVGQFYGYVVDGIFQTTTEIAVSMQTDAKPGDFKFKDLNGDKVITDKDRQVLGNPNPKYTYGLNTTFNYKNFDLSLDFQGVAKVDIYNANVSYRFGNENFTKDFYDNRWHGAGTSNTYPSANVGSTKNAAPNSFYVEDGSYFRVRNMQLGYTLPQSLLGKFKTKAFRVYVDAQNAFNFFKYKGFSPELSGGSPIEQNIDNNVYPLYATYRFGVNVTF